MFVSSILAGRTALADRCREKDEAVAEYWFAGGCGDCYFGGDFKHLALKDYPQKILELVSG